VILTSAAVIENASNATLLANLTKELVALMLRSKSKIKNTCDQSNKCDDSLILLQFQITCDFLFKLKSMIYLVVRSWGGHV